MLSGEWITIGKLNQITVIIDGKPIALRCTLHQVEQFQANSEKIGSDEKFTAVSVTMKPVEIVEIALNPLPGKIDFTRDQIMEKLDLDQINMLARVWIERKVFAPRIESDPILAPVSPGPKA
jgi:hypothetical protein